MLFFFKVPYIIISKIESIFYFFLLKIKYKNVKEVNLGSGGSYKFIIELDGKKFFVKKFTKTQDFWDIINKYFNDNMPEIVPSVSEKLFSAKLIKDTPELQIFCNVYKVDFFRKEIWTDYFEKGIEFSPNKSDENLIKKIKKIFLDHGLVSCDHETRNFIKINNQIKLIDIDSFQYVK